MADQQTMDVVMSPQGQQNDLRRQFEESATSPTDLLAAVQNAVVAINALNTTMGTIFPQATAYSTTAATAGAITFSSSLATGFVSIVTSSGATVKVAVYS